MIQFTYAHKDLGPILTEINQGLNSVREELSAKSHSYQLVSNGFKESFADALMRAIGKCIGSLEMEHSTSSKLSEGYNCLVSSVLATT